MLTIILGIVIITILGRIALHVCKNERSFMDFSLLLFAILLGAIAIGLIAPISGFNEWELIEETELVSLSNNVSSGGTGIVYVSLSADNTYSYRYEINSKFGTDTSKEYTTETLVGEDVEEVEDINCEAPVVRVYQRTGKKSIWTFALGGKETKYVFYVPVGTISKEVKLN